MSKLLLVEDDATMLSLLRTLLEIEGFEVLEPSGEISAVGVLEIVRSERPDVVLMDVHLRQVSGFDLLEAIRQDPEVAGTRILMSSGMELSIRCHQAGADSFILKPYMPDELVAKIRAMIGARG